MEWALRALGLFYTLSGFLYARSFATDELLQKTLHSLGQKQSDDERMRSYLLKAMAALTVASGLALLMLSSWIAPLMIINAVAQGAWLVFSRKAFAPEDASEQRGRAQTINAFVIWIIATAFALSVIWGGHLPLATSGAPNWLPPVGGLIFLIWMVLQ